MLDIREGRHLVYPFLLSEKYFYKTFGKIKILFVSSSKQFKTRTMNYLNIWKESILKNGFSDLTKVDVRDYLEFSDTGRVKDMSTGIHIYSGSLSMEVSVMLFSYYETGKGDILELEIIDKDLFFYYTDEDYYSISEVEAKEILEYILNLDGNDIEVEIKLRSNIM